MMTLYYVFAILICIGLSAFFSASEMSYSSANRLRLESAAEDGEPKAALAVRIIDHFDKTISAILIGNNLVNISMSSLGTMVAFILAGSDAYNWLATLVITVLVIIFGETMPKIIAKKNANGLAMRFSGAIHGLTVLLTPVIYLVVGLTNLITKPLKGEAPDDDAAVEELQTIIETAEDEAVLDEERSELLQNALDFSEISASEAMTARVDVDAIDIDDDWEDILALIEHTPYSRLPVYEESIDNIIGFLYLNHFFKAMTENEHPDLRALLMEPLYIYKTIRLPQVLSELRHAKKHLAIVTDEYGGTLGVISMEDVLEQIVGEIWDETDETVDEVVEKENGELELDGDLSIAEFLELLDRPEESFMCESETVGGWTIERFGAFPKAGDHFVSDNLDVTVLEMEERRVSKVLVKNLEVPENA